MDEKRLELDAGVSAWQTMADALPTILFVAAPNGDVEFVNRAWFKLTGYRTGEIVLKRRWADIVHSDDLPRLHATWDRALATGEPFELQHRIRKADGSYHWLLGRASPVHASDGSIVRWYGTATDIAEWKDAQHQLLQRDGERQTSERGFRALADAAPVILWTASADGWIDWYNQRWYEYTGLTVQEAAGWGWQQAHHPESFPEVMRQWPLCIATGEPFEMEFRLRAADGSFHWFLTRVQPLRDDDGKIIRWYGSNVDIEAQHRERDRSTRIAHTLQQVFLPKRLPHDGSVRFDAVYLPAETDALVGGDWYDAFALDDGRIAFSIGDVGGHGLEASVVAGSVRQAIFALTFRIDDPAELLREINRILFHQFPDTIVTALVGFVDRDRRALHYANAGHPPPIVAYHREGAAPALPFGTIPLGIRADLGAVAITDIALRDDAIVALYTDGLIEAGRDLAAGERTLYKLVPQFVGDITTASPADAIAREALQFTPPFDDAALLLMQFSNVAHNLVQRGPLALQKVWRFHSSDAYTAHVSRRELTAYLTALAAAPNETFSAELVLGEILANTVEHAPGMVEIHVDWTGEKPVILVRDSGPGFDVFEPMLPHNLLDENGRGLYLIRMLADDVTVRAASGFGSELRATLPVKRNLQFRAEH